MDYTCVKYVKRTLFDYLHRHVADGGDTMVEADLSLETAIVGLLQEIGSCELDDLTWRLSNYGWNPIFATLDQLSRDGRVVLHRGPHSTYRISLPLAHPVTRTRTGKDNVL